MPKKYLIFDFDSTFVTLETLEELAKIVLADNPQKEQILQEIQAITNLGMEGNIPFEESLSRRLALFNPTHESILQLAELVQTAITPSVLRNKAFFQKYAESIYIISGGFKQYIAPLAKEFGIAESHVLANSFLFDSSGSFQGIDRHNPLTKKGGKAVAVKNLHLNGTVYIIGDGYTDYEIKALGSADRFYAFTENISRDTVIAKADKVIKNIDEIIGEFLL